MTSVSNNLSKHIDDIIQATPGMKLYLMIHSVFRVDKAEREKDKLERIMVKKLFPTDREVAFARRILPVPQEIMDKLRVFDPQPLGYGRLYDNLQIMYNSWAKNPVIIIDEWYEIEQSIERRKRAAEMLAKTESIVAYNLMGEDA
jgi:hypothetical protein